MRSGRQKCKRRLLIMSRARPRGLWGLYIFLTWLFHPLIRWNVKRRLKKGKEDPRRYTERFGLAATKRPEGVLIWLHAVGLGEVMALRSIIPILAKHCPEAHFLVTSGTRQSAVVFAVNLPNRTIHQYFPADITRYCRRFLEHWKPDICIWSEQELWPNMIWHADQAGIPQVVINARMNERAYKSRVRFAQMFGEIYRRFALISAQDEQSARHITALGGKVRVDGSLKPLAPALEADEEALRIRSEQIGARPILCLASSHPNDEDIALAALAHLPADTLLVIVPRRVERAAQILEKLGSDGFAVSVGDKTIEENTRIHVEDQVGELGLWYRLCSVAFIGGGFDDTQGHNPWEAVTLNCPILHGPKTQNFAQDYESLDTIGIARKVLNSQDVSTSFARFRQDYDPALKRLAVEPALANLDKLGQDIITIMSSQRA